MNLTSLRALLAAPLASLFLILTLVLFAHKGSVSTGIRVPVTHVRQIPFSDCYDDRDVFVFIRRDGSVRINETPEPLNNLKRELSDIFRYRREQAVVYVLPEPETPFGDFVKVYDQVAASATNFHIGLITTGLDKELRKCKPQAVCGLEWPDHGYQHSCLFFNNPLIDPDSLRSPLASSKGANERTDED